MDAAPSVPRGRRSLRSSNAPSAGGAASSSSMMSGASLSSGNRGLGGMSSMGSGDLDHPGQLRPARRSLRSSNAATTTTGASSGSMTTTTTTSVSASSSKVRIVQVNVPPGPLGILLGNKNEGMSMIEGFAPISSTGERGAVELSGQVTPGSALIGVNQYDFEAAQMSFMEVGRVLRETAHMQRVMRFRVPISDAPPAAAPAIPAQAASMPPPPPYQAVQTVKETRTTVVASTQPAPPVAAGIPPSMATTTTTVKTSSVEMRTSSNSSLRQAQGPSVSSSLQDVPLKQHSSGVDARPTKLSQRFEEEETKEPQLASVPLPAPVVPAPTLAPALSTQASDAAAPERIVTVTVDAPPGPLGLNLDGAVTDKVIVRGFTPLPDGSTGALEQDGRILPGSILVQINEDDVSTWMFNEIIAKLGALSSEKRTLTFALPDPSTTVITINEVTTTVVGGRAMPVFVEDLDKRRALELALIMKHDTDQISRYECWFLIHTAWMESWIRFVAQKGPLPGPISNEALLQPDWEQRLHGEVPGRPDEPREGLQVMTDYRAVTPMVWCLYSDLYGTGSTPPLARYLVDIYAEPLREAAVAPILDELRLKAASLVQQVRDQSQIKQE